MYISSKKSLKWYSSINSFKCWHETSTPDFNLKLMFVARKIFMNVDPVCQSSMIVVFSCRFSLSNSNEWAISHTLPKWTYSVSKLLFWHKFSLSACSGYVFRPSRSSTFPASLLFNIHVYKAVICCLFISARMYWHSNLEGLIHTYDSKEQYNK